VNYVIPFADLCVFRKLDLRAVWVSSKVRRGKTNQTVMLKLINTHRLFRAPAMSVDAFPCWKAPATGYEADRNLALAQGCVR